MLVTAGRASLGSEPHLADRYPIIVALLFHRCRAHQARGSAVPPDRRSRTARGGGHWRSLATEGAVTSNPLGAIWRYTFGSLLLAHFASLVFFSGFLLENLAVAGVHVHVVGLPVVPRYLDSVNYEAVLILQVRALGRSGDRLKRGLLRR